MKASELIEKLEQLIDENGDRDIHILDECGSIEVHDVAMRTNCGVLQRYLICDHKLAELLVLDADDEF